MTAPLVSFSGIAAGFDYRSLVDAIIAQERQPAVRLESQLSSFSQQQSALATYRTRLADLRTAARALRDGTAFDATTATTTIVSGSKALATVTTSPATQTGSFSLTVSQLARTEKLAGTSVASASDPLGPGGTVTINGTDITLTATDSLVDLASKINALNTGTSPIGVSATILSVSATDQRLLLTSATSGAAGITLADTAGTVLQDLGFLDGVGGVQASAVLVDGADAVFQIDGIALTRTSNVITDAIEGVTLTLVSEEPGAETAVSVGRFADATEGALQTFVETYNALVDFLKAQGTATDESRPALYNDSLVRGLRRDLPTQLLTSVLGAAPDLATAASVGLSLDRDGRLSLDATKFSAAFASRYDDVRALFSERGVASSPDVSFVSSGGSIIGGSYPIDITAVPAKATTVTAGFGGVYDAGLTPDTIQIVDTRSGRSVTVTLTTGMTTAQIVQAIQDALTTDGLGIDVAAVGNEIQLTQQSAGSAAGIQLVFTGLGDGAAEAWGGGLTVTGTDIAGTIGGLPATGTGDLLVGDAGGATAGLTVRYTGTTAGPVGTLDLTVGTGAAVERLLERYLDTGGLVDTRAQALTDRTDRANSRIDDIDRRLEQRRANLLRRFLAMETAIARLQQSSSSFLSSLAPQTGSTG